MILLFPSYPSDIRRPDPAFAKEMRAAKDEGFQVGFVDIEFMFGGDVHVKLPVSEDKQVMYRGWILKDSSYKNLYETLDRRGLSLINTPEEYRRAQLFPEWYPLLEGKTPHSVWLSGLNSNWNPKLEFNKNVINELTNQFGDSPIIVKDYMKSRKQDWFEACYIPSAADKDHVHKVVNKFLDLQGDTLVGGLVFRKFEDLEQIGIHAKIKMPLVNEWRMFVLNGQLIDTMPYWEDGEYNIAAPEFTIPQLNVGFYSLDIAKKVSGEWTVIEIGDGGSSGIPSKRNPKEFYSKLKNHVKQMS